MSRVETENGTGGKKQVSEKQRIANINNSKLSTGPRTASGRMRASMNNCTHGMFSTQDLIPGECPIRRQELVDEITAAVNPGDGVARLLTERIIKTAWKVRRGERAQDARATKRVNATLEGVAARDARRAEALGAELDERVAAFHELRTFPAGVSYLLREWSIIRKSLSQGLPLLASMRRRCFSLNGKTYEQVLRSDRQATRWFLGLAGLMYGKEATVEDILALLGTDPPEWMQEAEFVTRATRLQRQLPTKAAARELLTGYVTKVMKRLKKELAYVKEVADRDLGLDATEAAADVTPAGISLANAIDKVDRSCMAAIRKLEAWQRTPARPGLGRDPKKPATAAEAVRDVVEPGQDEPAAAAPGPEVAPAAVAADAQAPLAPEVQVDDPAPAALSMTEAAEPRTEDDPGLSTAEAVAEICRVEPISELAPTEPDFERFGPYAGHLSNLKLMLDATYGDGGSSDAPGAEPAFPEGLPAGTSSRPDPGDMHQPGTPADGDSAPRDSPLARATEQWRLRQEEISRQLDEHFAIDGNRPDPGRPPPV